jgi:hypothetical protein
LYCCLASIEALNKTNTTTKKRVTKHLADILKVLKLIQIYTMKQISLHTHIYSPNITIITINVFLKYFCSKYLINEYLINIILVKYIHLNTLNIPYLINIILVKYI